MQQDISVQGIPTPGIQIQAQMDTVQPQQAPSDTCREFSDPTPTAKPTPIGNAGRLRAEYDKLHGELEAWACSAKEIVETEFFPRFLKMRYVLSQRGEGHTRKMANVPTWQDEYASLMKKFPFLPSLRTFQRWQAKLEGRTPRRPRVRTAAPKQPPLITGQTTLQTADRELLLGLLAMIENGEDMAVILQECAAIRKVIAGEVQ